MLDHLKKLIRQGKYAKQDHPHSSSSPNPIMETNIPPQSNVPRCHEDYEKAARDIVRGETVEKQAARQRNWINSVQRYQLLEKLGEGAFSKVYKALDSHLGGHVAIKVIQKLQLDEKQRASVLKEVTLLRQLNHPNIVKFLDFIETEEFYYIIQELVEGGEVFNQVVKYTYLSEDLTRHVIIQVAEALLYLHDTVGIVHRDLKPENIFFSPIPLVPSRHRKLRQSDDPATKLDEGEFTMNYGGGGIGLVKIGDFGLSKQIVPNSALKTPCGTVGYTAPEIVNDMKYSKEVDMWALGCVLYVLLCGFPPFFNDSIDKLTKQVAKGEFKFLEPWWDEISVGAKNCVSRLMTVDPAKRYTISEFLEDPWILDFLHRSEAYRAGYEDAVMLQSQPLSDLSSTTGDNSWPDTVTLPRYESFANSRTLTSDDGLFTHSTPQSTKKGADLFSPAVIALKEALDITATTHRQHEEYNYETAPQSQSGPSFSSFEEKPFKLNLEASSILRRRRDNEAAIA